ncbi:35952_t:CDS:2, partial [Racocetra persica]
ESKIQAINEIKKEYKNITDNFVSQNLISHQPSTSKSAMANIFAKRNQTILTPIYDEFIRYQNKDLLPALEEHDPFKCPIPQ